MCISIYFFENILPFLLSLLREIITKYYIDSRNRSSTSKGISSGRICVNKWIWRHHTLPNFFGRTKTTHRHYPTSKSLSTGNNIRTYPPIIHSPKSSCSSKSCLYLICNQKRSILFCQFTCPWPKIIRGDNRSSLSLDWFK